MRKAILYKCISEKEKKEIGQDLFINDVEDSQVIKKIQCFISALSGLIWEWNLVNNYYSGLVHVYIYHCNYKSSTNQETGEVFFEIHLTYE